MGTATLHSGVSINDVGVFLPNIGRDPLHKFGQNPDVDGAEDIWTGGGDYPWPAAAATTTFAGGANDTADGTGARSITVLGVDANYLLRSETKATNGITDVTLDTEFLRVFRAFVTTCGSVGTNEAAINIKHGATTIAIIPAGQGQTQMAIYTLPADYVLGVIFALHIGIVAATNQDIDYALLVRPQGGAWLTIDIGTIPSTTPLHIPLAAGEQIAPKSDIRLRVTRASTTNMVVTGVFNMIQVK